jgi:ParB/RepB/Spo0J family partition protein
VESTLLHSLPLDLVHESAQNPRRHFDEAAMAELVESIKARGILSPLLVRERDGGYEVIAGARRLRAARLANLTSVPAVVLDHESDEIALEDGLIENLQRDSMRPMEEARAFGRIAGTPPTIAEVRYLGERIGKPATYVWDRIKLLDLISDAQQLLERGTLKVDAAQLIARLTPDQQEKAIDPTAEAAFDRDYALGFEDELSDDDVIDPWAHVKPRSLPELRKWIAKHCRFKPEEAVQAAPLEFGTVVEEIGRAYDQPGRGKKVVSITYDSQLHPDARGEGERTYCVTSWKRADGRDDDSPTCEHSILGVVVAGSSYGQTFQVCVNKDCDSHWGREKREREKFAKQRQANPGAAEQKVMAERAARLAKEQEERAAWERATPAILEALAAGLKKAKTMKLVSLMTFQGDKDDRRRALGPVTTADDALRHAILGDHWWEIHNGYLGPRDIPKLAKALGVDLKAVLKAATTQALDGAMKKAESRATAGKATKTAKKGRRG